MAKLPRATDRRRSRRAEKAPARPARASARARVALLVGTRKGAFIFKGDPSRRTWRLDGPHFLGHIVNHFVLDPRDGHTMLMASKTGHLGPTIYVSNDLGRWWVEAKRSPAFPRATDGAQALSVDHTFFLAPAHASEPGAWYAGTAPPALFRSEDGGMTWSGVEGLNGHSMLRTWIPLDDGTPDGSILHSILIDPRDAQHMYVSASGGGTFESLDQGASWRPLNRGVEANFQPDSKPDLEFGQDPHCVWLHPLKPDRLYQQNHCGIYRIDRPAERWERVGNNMPRAVGDIGFPIVLHPRDPDTAWVFPMDGTFVWPRISPGGKPAVYRTRDAGATWERQDRGLPRRNAWLTVKRQGFSADAYDPVGLYFGTTSGEVWLSTNEGASWRPMAAHLPEIYSVVAAMVS